MEPKSSSLNFQKKSQKRKFVIQLDDLYPSSVQAASYIETLLFTLDKAHVRSTVAFQNKLMQGSGRIYTP